MENCDLMSCHSEGLNYFKINYHNTSNLVFIINELCIIWDIARWSFDIGVVFGIYILVFEFGI